MKKSFNRRVFGCAIIKAINSNYNADFTSQPRTLPDGTVYATDKALKYTVRNYLVKNFANEKVFYFKNLNEEMQPLDLGQTYAKHFGELSKDDKKGISSVRKTVLTNLLTCIDVRLFGGTFASKSANLHLHGTVQITHGVNRFTEGIIYSEQISSPFRNSNDKSTDSMQTTLGTQYKLREGHYVHHLSINPRNLEEMNIISGNAGLTTDDIQKLKEALRNGATFYDSTSKSGVENELLLWVELKEGSKLVLPSFVELTAVNTEKEVDLSLIAALLKKENIKSQIEKVEIFYNKEITKVIGRPEGAILNDLN
jgi:CRISPR-associated protein Csh2